MIDYKSLEFIKSRIEENHNFIITTHQNPDGDAIGSSIALNNFFNQIGKNSKIINYNAAPDYLNFLDENNEISIFDINKHSEDFKNCDIIFVLDLNSAKRLMDLGKFITTLNKEIIVIDHHLEPQEFATYYHTNTDVASTCELIWELIDLFDIKLNLISSIGLYTGIVTDTGSFGFDRTTSKTHLIASELIKLGVEPNKITEYIYNSSSLESLHLYGDALKSIELHFNEKLSIMTITQKMLSEAGLTDNDLDGFSSAALRIKSVKSAITIVELEETGLYKLSFRAKKGYGIRNLASEFGGGGHELASGARVSKYTLKELKKDLIDKAAKMIDFDKND